MHPSHQSNQDAREVHFHRSFSHLKGFPMQYRILQHYNARWDDFYPAAKLSRRYLKLLHAHHEQLEYFPSDYRLKHHWGFHQ